MLPGFTSRWTIPRTCATPSARATSSPMRTACTRGQPTAALESSREVLSVDEVHHEVWLVLVGTRVEAGHDVRVPQDRGR